MLIPVLLFIVGLLFLIKGGDWFVDGASALARRFHLPELLIGATVVSIGTTLPEVMVSTMSALSGHGEIAYGNAIGSVICNAALIAAITIAVRPGKVDPKTLKTPVAFFFAAAAIYCAAAYVFGRFTRVMGIIMLAMFVAYMVVNVLQMKNTPAEAHEDAEEEMPLAKTLVLLVLGAVLIALGANLLVDNGTLIAQALGVPESVIALTFVALGTSLPELVTAITSLVKGHSDLSLGNVVGANVFNLVLVSGVSVTLAPLHRSAERHSVRHQLQPCAGAAGHAGCYADPHGPRPVQGQAEPCAGHFAAGDLRRLLRCAVHAVNNTGLARHTRCAKAAGVPGRFLKKRRTEPADRDKKQIPGIHFREVVCMLGILGYFLQVAAGHILYLALHLESGVLSAAAAAGAGVRGLCRPASGRAGRRRCTRHADTPQPAAGGPYLQKILRGGCRAGRLHLDRHHRPHQGCGYLRPRQGQKVRQLCKQVH